MIHLQKKHKNEILLQPIYHSTIFKVLPLLHSQKIIHLISYDVYTHHTCIYSQLDTNTSTHQHAQHTHTHTHKQHNYTWSFSLSLSLSTHIYIYIYLQGKFSTIHGHVPPNNIIFDGTTNSSNIDSAISFISV